MPQEARGEGEVTFGIESLDLVEGTYKLDVAVHKRDGYPYDYHRLLYTFRVKSRSKEVGIYRPRHAWTFSPNIKLTKRRRNDTDACAKVLSLAEAEAFVERLRHAQQDSRVHQRRVRSAASGPRALSAGCPARRGCARRRGQLGPVGARDQRTGPSSQPGTRTRRSAGGARVRRRGRGVRRRQPADRSSAASSPTCSSRAPIGRPTRSSAAKPSRRAAAGSCASRSRKGYSTSAIIEKIQGL